MKTKYLPFAWAAALFCGVSFGGSVVTLSDPVFSGQCNVPTLTGGSVPCSANNVYIPSSGGSASDSASYGLSGTTGPFVSASGAGNGAGTGYGGNAELQYQIMISGPAGTVEVDVNYLAALFGTYSPSPLGNDETTGLNAYVGFQVGLNSIINNTSPSIEVSAFGGSTEYGFAPSFSDTSVGATRGTNGWTASASGPVTITLPTNTAINVSLQAVASCTSSQGDACSATATLDPTFAIDPSQANFGQYSIQLSPGVGNGSPVSGTPEPGTILLIGAGLLGLGIVRRQKTGRAGCDLHLR